MLVCSSSSCRVENGLPKKTNLKQKNLEIMKGRKVSRLWNSEGIGGGGGVMHFGFLKARGVKTWKPFVVGYGYFLELLSDARRKKNCNQFWVSSISLKS